MSEAIHYRKNLTLTACNREAIHFEESSSVDEVTCKVCKSTVAYAEAVKKRKAKIKAQKEERGLNEANIYVLVRFDCEACGSVIDLRNLPKMNSIVECSCCGSSSEVSNIEEEEKWRPK